MKKKRYVEVYACCSKCNSIKPLWAIPNTKCSNFECNDNTKFKSFYYKGSIRKYVNNQKIRYRDIKGDGRLYRSIKVYV